jgi:hypothetical protein
LARATQNVSSGKPGVWEEKCSQAINARRNPPWQKGKRERNGDGRAAQ